MAVGAGWADVADARANFGAAKKFQGMSLVPLRLLYKLLVS